MDLRVLRVVVASPGDVKPEREIVPKVVDEVNRNIARPLGLHLDVYRWETDSHPGFHPQGPQGLIDPQLKIEDCDLLIGIFWKRFGKPVSDAKSGTEHEFRIAYAAWQKKRKPQIMMYFSQKKYFAQSTEETTQAGLVLQFKKDFPPEGLWWDYKNKAEFEGFLRNHLTQFLQEQSPLKIKSETKQPETSPLTPLFQLPPPPADFTGRAVELAELRAAIEKGGVHISGLQGQGGVGKTALALKLAAELATNYPDAQIYLDLKGVSEKPLTAAEAMSHVLHAFHPEARLPEKEEDLCAQYLSVLHNKRALLLMDNAKNAVQVKLLIPPPNCALLLTSRQHFALPGLQAKNLETLPLPDAKDLLLRIAPRIGGEAGAIAKLCGYLPQALRLAASAIAVRVNLEPRDYAKQLADEKKRLELLAGDDESVTASITLSYNLLDAETQKHWRMLAVFPDTFDALAAAAVWEIKDDPANEELSRFLQYSMLEWNDSTKRHRLHDLMRDFARQRLLAAELHAAAFRHAKHYEAALATANELYKAGGESLMRGLALLDLEWENVRTGQAWAARTDSPEDHEIATLCSRYPDRGTPILILRQHPREQIRWREEAISAVRLLKDRALEARNLGNLGVAYGLLGDHRHAIEYHGKALAILRELGSSRGVGQALGNLGLAYRNLGDYRRAIEYYEQVLATLREVGDQRIEATTLGNLGVVYLALGEHRRSIKYFDQYLAIARTMGSYQGEGMALCNLGMAHYLLGETPLAIEHYEQGLAILREIGDQRGEGQALANLANAYVSLGEYHRSITCYGQALAITREIGDRVSEGGTLGNLGSVYQILGEVHHAMEYTEQHLAITREVGDRRGESTALWNISLLLDKLGDRKKAIEHAEAALKICEQIEDPNAANVKEQLDIWRNS